MISVCSAYSVVKSVFAVPVSVVNGDLFFVLQPSNFSLRERRERWADPAQRLIYLLEFKYSHRYDKDSF